MGGEDRRGETYAGGVENLLNYTGHGACRGHPIGNAARNRRWRGWDERSKILPPTEMVGASLVIGIFPKACAFRVSLLLRSIERLPYGRDYETQRCLRGQLPAEVLLQ